MIYIFYSLYCTDYVCPFDFNYRGLGKSFHWVIGDRTFFAYKGVWNEPRKYLASLCYRENSYLLVNHWNPTLLPILWAHPGVSTELIIHVTRLHFLHSLTERAQLLKNVFKKNHVNLYRSESLQQNLLRKCLSSI